MAYQTHVRLDDDLAAAVKAYVAENRISIADWIRLLIVQRLKEEGKL